MGLLDKSNKSKLIRSYRGYNLEIVNPECEAMGTKDMDDDLFIQMFNRYPLEAFIENNILGYDIVYDKHRLNMICYLWMDNGAYAQIHSRVMTHDYHSTVKGGGFEFYVGIDERAKCDY